MESQRNIILIGLVFVTFLLWQQWQITHRAPVDSSQPTEIVPEKDSFIPQSTTLATPESVLTQSAAEHEAGNIVVVSSDVLRLKINTLGGDIIEAQLLAYDESLDDPRQPFTLLDSRPQHLYVAQSGLIGANGPDANKDGRPVYTTLQTEYHLSDAQTSLAVPLTFRDANGLEVTKTFTLKRGQYDVDVCYDLRNQTSKPAYVQMYGQLKQQVESDASSALFVASAFRGGVYSNKDNHYKKVSFSDMGDSNLNKASQGGWIGMIQHYFASVWIPASDAGENQFYSRLVHQGESGIMGFKSPLVTIPTGEEAQINAMLWVGPKLQDQMAQVAPYLNLTVDYGWLWFIAQPLHWLLEVLHHFVFNWGIAIILLTFVVRMVMYPLTKAQYTSMAKMRLLQPKLMSLKDRYGDDRQRMSQAMMELYKKEKVNPLGGCFPILLQMPIFIALYWTLLESVELRHAPFMLWINDLSMKDPFFTLPVLTGVSMYFIQKMSPTTVTDPVQQKVMQMMPVIFTVFFLWCPAGLTLYWLVNNILTIVQQMVIFKQLEKKGLHTRQAS